MKLAPAYHLAHFNWAILRADWEDPAVAGFVDNLDRVNALAERSEGFVWRMTDEDMEDAQNDPAGVLGANPRLASTLSVWESVGALDRFVHRTLHGKFLARRAEWFLPQDGPTYVLWPVLIGHRPTLADAKARLDQLAANGPGPEAFDFGWARVQAVAAE